MIQTLRAIAFAYACRLAVPIWVLAGACFKLVERNPKLLPSPVLDTVRGLDGAFGSSGVAWLDLSMRIIILGEFALVAIMLTMPRLARMAAIITLSIFCLILLVVIVPAFNDGGIEGAIKGSCGCFGTGGPNPLAMLVIDGMLLFFALAAKRSVRAMPTGAFFGLPAAACLVALGLSAIWLTPRRADIDLTPNEADTASTAHTVAATTESGWPGLPAQAAPYYIPEFSSWIGARLDSQEMARLMTPEPPASLNQGTWFVLFYRMDCEHCHELMQARFTGPLDVPILAIAIPDTDPAAHLEMPCEVCQLRTLVKGPEYVLTTPVLMRVENGVVTRLATDPEDHDAIERCMKP
ncbi:MAG: hypothetical protein EXS03_00740 [Phycisphaerales bacterium]|nr:hypothetical protein [Phycisphaerales bacterium]